MSKNIISALRSLAPYLKEQEAPEAPKGLLGRSEQPKNTESADPKQSIANYVKIIRQQRNKNAES